MAKRSSKRHEVWQHRRAFLEAAQRKVPAIGRYLRRFGIRASDRESRTQVIRSWQAHFNLNYGWAFESAWATLAMWDGYPNARQSIHWFAHGRAHNLAEEGLPTFEFRIERQFYPDLDFGWFKQSVQGALEAELDRFGMRIGAEDLGHHRQPKNLQRAYECLALRVCKNKTPQAIASLPEYCRDWTTLWKDIKSASELIGLPLPGRGRPRTKSAK
jgi:hypothetical protein